MTVQTRFWNWQTQGAPPDVHEFAAAGNASPNLRRILDWLTDNYGGQNLGYYPNPRDVRGGTSQSTHTWGALDWRYENPGPGRAKLLAAILPFLIGNSLELGIDAVHDYVGDRIWRPPGTSGRPAGSDGWKAQNGSGGQMGAAWAQWIHIELHPDAWFDARTVAQTVRPQPPTTPPEDAMRVPIGRFDGTADVFVLLRGSEDTFRSWDVDPATAVVLPKLTAAQRQALEAQYGRKLTNL